MKNLENKIPPAILVVLWGAAMWLMADITFVVALSQTLRWSLVLIVLLLAVFFCLAGVISFRRAKTTVNPLKPDTASSLVSSGIYQISRNPMYLGFALVLVSWSVYLGAPMAVLGVAGFIWSMNRFQIRPEERALLAIFGREFEQYSAKVRRWL